MWTARYGNHLAQGDGWRVTCSEDKVEAAAVELLADGGMNLTPTGPFRRLPDEMATWVAFLTALQYTHPEIVEMAVTGGPRVEALPFSPEVIY